MGIFADLFSDMMPNIVTVQRITQIFHDGGANYGPAKTYIARVNNVSRNIMGPNGQMVVTRGRAWLDTIDPFGVNDLVTFEDGSKPILLNVNQVPDENGPCYTSFDFQ